MEQENSQLDALLCKVRSLERWRLAVLRARFRGQLSRAEKVSAHGTPAAPDGVLLVQPWQRLAGFPGKEHHQSLGSNRIETQATARENRALREWSTREMKW